MTIEEVKAAKSELELKIEDLPVLFEKETGLAINGLFLNTIPIGYAGDKAIYQVGVDVKI